MKYILAFTIALLSSFSFAQSKIKLPPPDPASSTIRMSKVIGWPKGKMPIAPKDFKVEVFTADLSSPRWIYVAPNKDVFVAEAGKDEGKPNRITMFRDKNHDGKYETKSVYLTDLQKPFGMLVLGSWFYVANEGSVVRYKYNPDQIRLQDKGEKIMTLPTGHHWTRNIVANKEGTKIYVSVGSGSNVAENGVDKEVRRAAILEANPDGSGERIFASGLRNPVGMAWHPKSGALWTAVNERDELGNDLVPDYITSVKEGGFYGWPYSYFGQNVDARVKEKRPDLVKKAIVPDVAMGAHTASLGLAFYDQSQFPARYSNGAFVGQHGSWNRKEFSGYKVAFVPFNGAGRAGEMEDFLTGFIVDPKKDEVYGRPVGVAVLPDGSLLVADDGGNVVWKVSYAGK